MALFLEILDGELKGTRVPVYDGFAIGRREGDLTIKDSKLSSKHALVQARAENQLWLVDNGSANKIKIGEARVKEVQLTDGTQFVLGRTPFVVILVQDEAQGDVATVAMAEAPPKTVWDDILKIAERAATAPRAPNVSVEPFAPALKLTFIRGLQTGVEWTLGYGPREIGAHSLDLRLEEIGAAPICFRVLPRANGVMIKSLAASNVLLNGAPLEEAILQEGDVIEIHHTRIQVSFYESSHESP